MFKKAFFGTPNRAVIKLPSAKALGSAFRYMQIALRFLQPKKIAIGSMENKI